MKISRALLVLVLTVVGVPAVFSVEPIAVPLSTDASLPLYNEDDFAWSGFYAGLQGGVAEVGGAALPSLGAQLGVNTQFDFYLVGAEVAVRGVAEGAGQDGQAYAQILGKAGLVTDDSVLIYGAAGFGVAVTDPSSQDLLIGGGLEIPISESVSLNAQYLRGIAPNGDSPKNLITFGANWHF